MKTSSCVVSILFALWTASLAFAGPRVWVAARGEVVFDRESKIVELRHAWEFDEFYSDFVIRKLDNDTDRFEWGWVDLVSSRAIEPLAAKDYFTLASQGETKVPLEEPRRISIERNKRDIVTLRFTLPLATPVAPRQPFRFRVFDPTYLVSFGFEKTEPVTLVGAPSGCNVEVFEPEPLVTSYGQEGPTTAEIVCR